MGLDISLYRYKNHAEAVRKSKKFDTESEKIWEAGGGYNGTTEAQKDEIRAKVHALAEELGVNEWGADEGNEERIELDSKKYPEHLFKIGYCRSSYNGGGFDHVVDQAIGETLYSIFGYDQDDYEFQPDWEAVKENATNALKELKKHIKKSGGVRVLEVTPFWDDVKPSTEAEALELYMKQLESHKSGAFDSYSNKDGEFYLGEPLKVKALIYGKSKGFMKEGRACTFVVFDDTEGLNWYAQAIEVIIEMADYVLESGEEDKFWLHWSA